MPDVDGGHYFLTALSPVLDAPVRRADGSVTSPAAMLRETLATLPAAGHGAPGAARSPFARSPRTHLARWVVIDQPAFNGRDAGNALIEGARKTDLLVAGPVDTLPCAWLLLAVDLDAEAGVADHGLDGYLRDLWAQMPDELAAVYRNCHGFAEVRDGAGFAAYVRRCQVATTMSFNDYWTVPPPLPSLSLGAVLGVAALAAAALAWGATRLLGIGGGWSAALLVPALALTLWLAAGFVAARGARPFPAAPGSDLPTILKALYLQQRFARFAVTTQGRSAAELNAGFAAFLADERPADLAGPTRPAGSVAA